MARCLCRPAPGARARAGPPRLPAAARPGGTCAAARRPRVDRRCTRSRVAPVLARLQRRRRRTAPGTQQRLRSSATWRLRQACHLAKTRATRDHHGSADPVKAAPVHRRRSVPELLLDREEFQMDRIQRVLCCIAAITSACTDREIKTRVLVVSDRICWIFLYMWCVCCEPVFALLQSTQSNTMSRNCPSRLSKLQQHTKSSVTNPHNTTQRNTQPRNQHSARAPPSRTSPHARESPPFNARASSLTNRKRSSSPERASRPSSKMQVRAVPPPWAPRSLQAPRLPRVAPRIVSAWSKPGPGPFSCAGGARATAGAPSARCRALQRCTCRRSVAGKLQQQRTWVADLPPWRPIGHLHTGPVA